MEFQFQFPIYALALSSDNGETAFLIGDFSGGKVFSVFTDPEYAEHDGAIIIEIFNYSELATILESLEGVTHVAINPGLPGKQPPKQSGSYKLGRAIELCRRMRDGAN